MIAIIHALATASMVGVIWTMQLVHYPLMAAVGEGASLRTYALRHQRRITVVVGPLMLIELATATWLALVSPASAIAWIAWAVLAAIWIDTALVMGRLHAAIAQDGAAGDVGRLVRHNWIRTIAWTLRLPLAVVLIAQTI